MSIRSQRVWDTPLGRRTARNLPISKFAPAARSHDRAFRDGLAAGWGAGYARRQHFMEEVL